MGMVRPPSDSNTASREIRKRTARRPRSLDCSGGQPEHVQSNLLMVVKGQESEESLSECESLKWAEVRSSVTERYSWDSQASAPE